MIILPTFLLWLFTFDIQQQLLSILNSILNVCCIFWVGVLLNSWQVGDRFTEVIICLIILHINNISFLFWRAVKARFYYYASFMDLCYNLPQCRFLVSGLFIALEWNLLRLGDLSRLFGCCQRKVHALWNAWFKVVLFWAIFAELEEMLILWWEPSVDIFQTDDEIILLVIWPCYNPVWEEADLKPRIKI